MADLELIKSISMTTSSRILLIVIDGLGGLPHTETGRTELETARKPNLDKLASQGICGLIDPVAPGITPGSAPGHLGLFGYDPVKYNIGRGVLEATGVDFPLKAGDIAARGNFCTIDKKGKVIDRRAGRISTEQNTELCRLLDGQVIDGIEVFVSPVKEHRFIVVFRGKDLSPGVSDSDPQRTGVAPKAVIALSRGAKKTADIANRFIALSMTILKNWHPANMVLLRGFSRRPDLPGMADIYKLKPAAIVSYPMYRGLARLVGMEVLKTGTSIEEEFATLVKNYKNYDFFFLHVKGADEAGEDGDFKRKVKIIEQVDKAIAKAINMHPDVIVVTGDHSTPALLKAHSWHPVPVLMYSKWCRADKLNEFGESACILGGLGRIPATDIMPLAMANALKLTKFGA